MDDIMNIKEEIYIIPQGEELFFNVYIPLTTFISDQSSFQFRRDMRRYSCLRKQSEMIFLVRKEH